MKKVMRENVKLRERDSASDYYKKKKGKKRERSTQVVVYSRAIRTWHIIKDYYMSTLNREKKITQHSWLFIQVLEKKKTLSALKVKKKKEE